MIRVLSRIVVIGLILISFSACTTIAYYHQSISGHFKLISKRERIPDIVNDSTRDEKLIAQLRLVEEIRSFASSQLKLPENDSYHSYVQLEKPYVTWNVFAAPEFSTTLHQWCFLVLGCVPYRGYFDEAKANHYAEVLSEQGLDVYVAGVPAYSTLGWFDDPLLSSMLDRGEIVAAAYIFHELAHQQFYLKGDGAFNEAFATAVEEIGVLEWLAQQNRVQDAESYQHWLLQKSLFSEFVHHSRQKFEDLYTRDIDAEQMRNTKQSNIETMRKEFADMSKDNQQIARYSRWMTGPLNNAQLGAISLYRELAPAFRRIFGLCENDFQRFYTYVEKIAKQPVAQRETTLRTTEVCK
jgi:predicted aminopeptidase